MIWLVRLSDGKLKGPLSTEEILRGIRRGEFSGEDMFSEYATGNWRPFAQNPEFYDELLKVLEDEEREIDDSVREDPNEVDNEEPLSGLGQAASPSSSDSQNKSRDIPPSEGAVIDLKKKNEHQNQKFSRDKKIIFWASSCVVVLCLFMWFWEGDSNVESASLHLISPKKGQPPLKKDQIALKRQEAIEYFQLDTRWGYSKAQNKWVQLIEGTEGNLDAYSFLCLTYLELWPYVSLNAKNLEVVSQTTQLVMGIDPTDPRGVTCRVVEFIFKGEYKKAKSMVEGVLETLVSAGEGHVNFYYFKSVLLAYEGQYEVALGYLNSAQKLWPSWLRLYSLEADLMIRSKRDELAARRLRDIIKSNPNHLEARIMLGRIEYLFYKRKREAKAILLDALKINDQARRTLMSQAYLTLSEIFLQEDRKSESLEAARQSYQWDPSNRAAKNIINQLGDTDEIKNHVLNDEQLVHQGDQFVRLGNCNAAQAHYKSAYDNNPKNGLAAMKASKCLWELSFSLEAIDWLKKAMVADPSLIEAYIRLADYYSQRYDYLAAMQTLAEAQKQAPQSYEIYRGYALVEKRRKNYQGVIHFVEQALKIHESDIESLVLMAEAYMEMEGSDKNYQRKAYSAATKAVEIDGSNMGRTQIVYGKSLFGVQGADASISYLSNLVSRFPLAIEYRLALGEVLLKDERYSRAEEAYKYAAHVQAKSKEAFLGLGHALQLQGKSGQALDAFLKAAILDPSAPGALFQAGLIYFNGSKFKEAKAQLLRVVKINERFPWVYYYLGQIDLKMNKPQDALRRAEEEKKINPHSAAPYLLAAEAYTLLKKYTLCSQEYQKAIQVLPQGADIYIRLARCYRQSGQLDVAKSMLEQAQELESGHPSVYRELGAIYESKRDFSSALAAYQRYLILAPNAPDAGQIRAKVEGL